MDKILDFFREFNVQNIISMGFIMWYFTRDLKTTLEAKIKNLDDDMKLMNKEFREMNMRVSRLEGTVYGKDVYRKD